MFSYFEYTRNNEMLLHEYRCHCIISTKIEISMEYETMTIRVQLALNVDDLEQAIDYYSRLFGVTVNKREEGYANFVVAQPPLKLVLFEASGATERLNHLGFEMFDDEAVNQVAEHLAAENLLAEHQSGEVCCFARQNKAISYDPQGLMWEWYRVLEDSPTFFAESAGTGEQSAAAVRPGCCS